MLNPKSYEFDSSLFTDGGTHELEICTNKLSNGNAWVNGQHDADNDCDSIQIYYDTTLASTGNVQDLSYTYDSNGNITQIVDSSVSSTNKTVDYTYDDINRLITATSTGFGEGDYSLSYAYDEVGNMTCKSDLGDGTLDSDGLPVPVDCTDSTVSNMTYAGTGSTSPHAVTSLADGTTFSYDANGNLESVTRGDGDDYESDGDELEQDFSLRTDSYTWNIKNQLESAGDSSYTYDHSGQRVTTTNLEGTNTYVNGLLEIRDTVESYSIFAGGTRVGSYTQEATNYHYQDHLGGTTITTDEDGTVTQLYDFAP